MSVLIKYFKNIFHKEYGNYTQEVFLNYVEIDELSKEINNLISPFLNGVKKSIKNFIQGIEGKKEDFKAEELADYLVRQNRELENIFKKTSKDEIVEIDENPLDTNITLRYQNDLIIYLNLIKSGLIETILFCTKNEFSQKELHRHLSKLHKKLNEHIGVELLKKFIETRDKIIKKSINFENKILKNKKTIKLLIDDDIRIINYYLQEKNDKLIYLDYLPFVKQSNVIEIRSYFENRLHYDSTIPFDHFNLKLNIGGKPNIHIIPIKSQNNVIKYFNEKKVA